MLSSPSVRRTSRENSVHEYSIIQALLNRVEAEAASRNASAVYSLSIRLGELSGVEPQLLKTAYETFREGTLCARADLELRQVPALWVCRVCEKPLRSRERLRCATCGRPGSLSEGDEIILDQIQLEVP